MRRPFRSFTVEIKRSRPRAGEASGSESRRGRAQELLASVSEPLSWGDLVSRASEEIAATTKEPSTAFWSGVNDLPADQQPAQEAAAPAARPSVAEDESTEPATPRSRVLPSLLLPETPLAERKPGVHAAVESRSSPRSRLRQSGHRQARALSTEPLRAAAAAQEVVTEPQRETQATGPVDGENRLDASQIRAAVMEHLRYRTKVEEVSIPLSQDPSTPEKSVVAARPTGKRNRQDFWKRRLRSYAARA